MIVTFCSSESMLSLLRELYEGVRSQQRKSDVDCSLQTLIYKVGVVNKRS